MDDGGPSVEELQTFALELADIADEITRPAFDAGPLAETKGDGTPVTAADTGTERALRERIGQAYPDHAVLGEEFGEQGGTAGVRWIIDPIDGTANFARGIPIWATLIAAEQDRRLVAAVASAPALHRRWWARLGWGAWTAEDGGEPRRIAVSGRATLAESQLLYSSLQSLAKAGHGGAVHRLVGQVWRDRGIGDFWAYMLIAEGAAEIMLEVGVNAWDLAAPALILAEAGGRLSDFAGEPSWAGPTSLATNGHLHPTMVEALNRTR